MLSTDELLSYCGQTMLMEENSGIWLRFLFFSFSACWPKDIICVWASLLPYWFIYRLALNMSMSMNGAGKHKKETFMNWSIKWIGLNISILTWLIVRVKELVVNEVENYKEMEKMSMLC